MADSAASCLRELMGLRLAFGGGAGRRKADLLRRIERGGLRGARQVADLHDLLCFLRAWPDGPEILGRAERMLEGFAARGDLRRCRKELAGSGIAGTEISFRFYHATAEWLARRWGGSLRIDWGEFENAARLESLLPLLGHDAEAPGLESYSFSVRRWIERMKGPGETDAAFLLRRFAALRAGPVLRQKLYEDLDPPLRLLPGRDTPSRSREKLPPARIHWQTRPLDRSRPDLKRMVRSAGVRFRGLAGREARRVVDLAKGAMVTRLRDLDAFAYADPGDVRLADFGNGVRVAVVGVLPERRFLLESLYGFVIFKNGVLVGYGTGVGLFGSCEVAFNLFPAFRGGETQLLYASVLCVFRRLFGADSFAVDPYQLGEDNEEALRSGAWWFYANLGFLPRDREAARLARAEKSRRKRTPGYRSPLSSLGRLAEHPLFLDLGRRRGDVLGALDLAPAGLAVTDFLARRFGSRREAGARACAKEAAELLGEGSLARLAPGEREAWRRWGPLVLALGSVGRWPLRDRRALARIIRAKGGRRESDFVLLFDGHRRLRKALRRTAERG